MIKKNILNEGMAVPGYLVKSHLLACVLSWDSKITYVNLIIFRFHLSMSYALVTKPKLTAFN